eukprot:Pompholyxophrys_sp_v1_NODE_307_length_796_cov_231.695007.p2 type:complete len:106 gc:universal NODE_307_length_796_cov_231.695007:255-572(+)
MRTGALLAPPNHCSAVIVGSPDKVSGKMSLWKESDLRGTVKEIGSTAAVVSLNARATSMFETSTARLGKKACGGIFEIFLVNLTRRRRGSELNHLFRPSFKTSFH